MLQGPFELTIDELNKITNTGPRVFALGTYAQKCFHIRSIGVAYADLHEALKSYVGKSNISMRASAKQEEMLSIQNASFIIHASGCVS